MFSFMVVVLSFMTVGAAALPLFRSGPVMVSKAAADESFSSILLRYRWKNNPCLFSQNSSILIPNTFQSRRVCIFELQFAMDLTERPDSGLEHTLNFLPLASIQLCESDVLWFLIMHSCKISSDLAPPRSGSPSSSQFPLLEKVTCSRTGMVDWVGAWSCSVSSLAICSCQERILGHSFESTNSISTPMHSKPNSSKSVMLCHIQWPQGIGWQRRWGLAR